MLSKDTTCGADGRAAIHISNTTVDVKEISGGFLLPHLVIRGEVGEAAEGSGSHKNRYCQSLPLGGSVTSIGAVARTSPSFWVKVGWLD